MLSGARVEVEIRAYVTWATIYPRRPSNEINPENNVHFSSFPRIVYTLRSLLTRSLFSEFLRSKRKRKVFRVEMRNSRTRGARTILFYGLAVFSENALKNSSKQAVVNALNINFSNICAALPEYECLDASIRSLWPCVLRTAEVEGAWAARIA